MLEYDRIDILEGIDVNKQMHQKSVIFVIIGTLKILVLNMNHILYLNFNDIAIVYVKVSAYTFHF